MKIDIQRGDEFAVKGTGWISKLILFVSEHTSLQNKAEYSHVGIVLNKWGKTIEALWDGIHYDTLDQYVGKEILIVRRISLDDDPISDESLSGAKSNAIREVKKFKGKIYPYWRFIFHAIPGLSKIRLIKIPVCSEMQKFYQHMCKKFKNPADNTQYWGYKPYRIVMDWKISKHYVIVYEGILKRGDKGSKINYV